MSVTTRSGVALAAVVAVLASAGPVAAAPPLIKLLAGNTREVYVDRNAVVVSFAAELPRGARASKTATTVVGVTFGSRAELRLKNAFSARLKPPVRADTALLLVKVDVDPVLKAGTYRLLITASGRVGKQKRKRTQRLTVSIVIPAATVRQPKTLTIEKTLPVLGFGGSTEKPSLQLRETSSSSRLTQIDVAQDGGGQKDGHSTSSTVEFDDAPNVDPGDKQKVGYSLNGSAFDHVGTVTGSVDIEAPELAAPVAFDYQVHVRYSPNLIFVIAALGLIAGFLVRILLQRIIDVSRAQQAGADLELRIENAEKDGDETLRNKLEPARIAVAPAFDWWSSATAVTDAVNSAEDLYRKAVADYTNRTREAVDAQATLSRVADETWTLPARLDAAFAAAREALVETKELLDGKQSDTAREAQRALKTALKHAVVDEAAAWTNEAEQQFRATETPPPPPAQLADAIAQAVQKARASIQKMPSAADAQLEELLPAFDRAVRDFDKLRPLLAATEAEVRAVRTRVPAAAQTLDPALANLIEAVGSSDSRPALMKDCYEKLMAAVDDVVRNNHGDEALRRQGKYADALPPPTPDATALSGRGAAAAQSPAPLFLALAIDSASPVISATAPAATVLERLPPARVLQRRIAWTLAGGWFIQWLFLSAFFVFASYWLFSDGWEGTWQQIIGVFLWAFALDVSANTLIDLKKTSKTTPTQAEA